MTWQILDSDYEQAKITVLGIGGGGGNSINHMIKSGIKGVNFICANTDAQDLSKIHSAKKIVLGRELTKGLGAGNDPEKGREATLQSIEEIKDILKIQKCYFLLQEWGRNRYRWSSRYCQNSKRYGNINCRSCDNSIQT